MTEALVVVGALAWAALCWWYLFGAGTQSWPRTWAVGAGLVAYAVGALALLGRLDEVVGPVGAAEVGLGVGVGASWLVATHVGHRVLCRWSPAFSDQVDDLYRRGIGDPPGTILGPLVLMAVAEELYFRGLVQGAIGLAGAVAAYTAVQLVERNVALALAALLGGTVWGLLAWWTGGLVAPTIAHALWTGVLTLVWPLRGCRPDQLLAPADLVGVPAGERVELSDEGARRS